MRLLKPEEIEVFRPKVLTEEEKQEFYNSLPKCFFCDRKATVGGFDSIRGFSYWGCSKHEPDGKLIVGG